MSGMSGIAGISGMSGIAGIAGPVRRYQITRLLVYLFTRLLVYSNGFITIFAIALQDLQGRMG